MMIGRRDPAGLFAIAPRLCYNFAQFHTKGVGILQQIRKWFAPRDMTRGTPWKVIGAFALPMLIGNFAQQLYNTVDSAVVGKYVGVGALAAVNSAMPAMMLLLALFMGIATGTGIRVSQYFGAKDKENLSVVIGNCLTLTAITAVIIMVLGSISIYPLLRIFNTPPEIIDMTATYLYVVFLGVAGSLYYNMMSGILRGLGDSLSALGFLLLSAALNVVLDLWFVISFGWGVFGVSLATIISQVVSAVLCYIKLSRMTDVFVINKQTLRLRKDVVMDIIKLGLPAGVTQMIFSLAMMLVLRLENSFGVNFVAATGIVKRVDGYAMMPNFTFGMAMTTYIGQNVGARKYDRLKAGAKQGSIMAVLVAVVLTVLILIFGRGIMHIFTDEESVVDTAMTMMRILAFGYIAMAVLQTMGGVMRGAGDTVTPMAISIITSVLIRVSLAYVLVEMSKTPGQPLGKPEMIYISLLITWVSGAVINYFAYRYGRWRRKLPQEGQPLPEQVPITMEE